MITLLTPIVIYTTYAYTYTLYTLPSSPTMLDALDPDSLLCLLRCVSVADVLSVASTCKALRRIASDDNFWRDLARRKWGGRVDELRPTAEPGPWRMYAARRMNLRPPRAPSPLNLLQEVYPDPWRQIVCCVLCSRTSGSDVIRSAIARFFDALPTPTAVLDAPDEVLSALLHPLGLQPVRTRAVRSISEGFLGSDWEDPAAFYGCGPFVADSWRIFCRNELPARASDATLQRYVGWARAYEAARRAGKEMAAMEEEEEQQEGEEGSGDGAGDDAATAAEPASGRPRAARRAAQKARAALAAGSSGSKRAAAAAARPRTRSSSGTDGLGTRAGGTTKVKGAAAAAAAAARKKGAAGSKRGRRQAADAASRRGLRDQTTGRRTRAQG